MTDYKKLCLEVEAEFKMGGLSGGLYEDYATEVARRAVLAEREANAIICHEIQMTKYSHDSGDEYYQGYGEGAKDCWRAIRARK